MLKIKRIYDPPEAHDGERILVDRIWPRGITKEQAQVSRWIREIAPSTPLRKWFAHDPEKWGRFRQRYRAELRSNQAEAILRELAEQSRKNDLTLVYGSSETRYNNACALKDFIGKMERP
jgi:uncharacterized protein YeaO (DUF488 family)